MNRKNILVTAVIFCFVVGVILWVVAGKKQTSLVAPGLRQNQQTPTSTPITPPKTFQLDSSTDLKAELEKVNPKVLDSDFENP